MQLTVETGEVERPPKPRRQSISHSPTKGYAPIPIVPSTQKGRSAPNLFHKNSDENLSSASASSKPSPTTSTLGGPTILPPPALTLGAPSMRIQSLSLEVGSDAIEESWKGEILPDFLYLGDRCTASSLDRLQALQISHVLNATEDIPFFFAAEGLTYMRCPIADHSDAAHGLSSYFAECVAFLESCRERGARVLVHCRAGVSRSATIVIGYLMQHKRWDLKTALHHVDERRFVQPNSGFVEFLLQHERALFGACSTSVAETLELKHARYRQCDGESMAM